MKLSAFIETAQMLIGGTDPLRMIAAAQHPIGSLGDFGAVAQLVERLHGMQEVRGS